MPMLAELKAAKKESLRIFSLRQEEEHHVSRNTTQIDARILRWLLQNQGRLPSTESKQLVTTLLDFRDLVHHQQLLIDDTSYSLLEALFWSSYTGPYEQLTESQRTDVLKVVGALAKIESESAVPESMSERKGNAQGIIPVMFSRSPVKLRLSSRSISLIRRLLGELRTLQSTRLIAFTLRLATHIVSASDSPRTHDCSLIARGTTMLLQRILDHDSPDAPTDSSSDSSRLTGSPEELHDAIDTED